MTATVDTLAARIAELWGADRAVWKAEYQPAMFGNEATWTVQLEWTSEHGNPHHADWVTYTWDFYDETLNVALADAVVWLEQLAPWRRCEACGGEGDEHQSACDVCHGSGMYVEEATS